MSESHRSVLFLGKEGDHRTTEALRYCQDRFEDVTYCLGSWGEALPEKAARWRGDYIISYLSRWIVPSSLLDRATRAAVNFHPAPPDYPGIGCVNFALYESAAEYGVTCHHMAPRVDTGSIIAVRRFPIEENDTVETLLERTYSHQLELFHEVLDALASGAPLPTSQETWTRAPISRRQFDELTQIAPDMGPEEVARRIRATTYGRFRPVLLLHGHRFEYAPATRT